MNYYIFFGIFSVLSLIYLFLGLQASKEIHTTDDYFLAGRKLGFIAITSTLIATHIGGGALIGTSQQAFNIGLWGIFYTLGIGIGLLILGLGIAARFQSIGISTTSQLFTDKYKSPQLAKVASFFSILSLMGLLVGQIIASNSILVGLNLGLSTFLAFWMSIIIYTVLGGLKAVVVTDIFQVFLILVVFIGIFFYSIFQNPSSLKDLVTETPSFNWSHLKNFGSTLLIPALYALFEEDLAQRFFASKSKAVASISSFVAAFFLLLFSIVPIYMGVQAKVKNLNFPPGSSPLIPFIETHFGDVVSALAICALIAAIVSTADSLLCALSSNVTQDLKINLGLKDDVKNSKAISLALGMLALALSFFITDNVISVLVLSYEISVSCLLIPIIAALFFDDLKKKAAYLSIIFGFVSFLILFFYPISLGSLISITASFIGFMLGTFLGKDQPA